jgi:hypothetical protein
MVHPVNGSGAGGPAPDADVLLSVVRRELDQLVAERLLVSFGPARQERYEELCRIETDLCQLHACRH